MAAKRRKPLRASGLRTDQILIVGGMVVLASALLIRGVVHSITKAVRNRHEESGNEAVSQTKSELKDLQRQGIEPTMSRAELEILANQIHTSIRYSIVADDKGRAEALLKARPQNQADVIALIRAYGKRKLEVFGLPDGYAKDLPSAISEELSQSRIDRINRTYQSKGITFRF